MIDTKDIGNKFETPLGVIDCGLKGLNIDNNLTAARIYKNGTSQIFNTRCYRIEFLEFSLKQPIYNGGIVSGTKAWVFRIEKISDGTERIESYCLLEPNDDHIEFDAATGEWLDAIAANNENWILHIGTEDGESLHARAVRDDWFPIRLQNRVNLDKPFTEMKKNGFITLIPDLQKGEKIHLQFLAAYDKRNDDNVNTWLAVEQTKKQLEDWIGLLE